MNMKYSITKTNIDSITSKEIFISKAEFDMHMNLYNKVYTSSETKTDEGIEYLDKEIFKVYDIFDTKYIMTIYYNE